MKVPISIRLPEELNDQLNVASRNEGISKTEFVTRVLRKAVSDSDEQQSKDIEIYQIQLTLKGLALELKELREKNETQLLQALSLAKQAISMVEHDRLE